MRERVATEDGDGRTVFPTHTSRHLPLAKKELHAIDDVASVLYQLTIGRVFQARSERDSNSRETGPTEVTGH